MGGCRSSTRSSEDESHSISHHRTSVKPNPSTRATTSGSSSGECDRCDGPHPTEKCPIFRKPRESHPDALRRKPMDMGGGGGNFVLSNARVVRQPGDGSCLFHSLSYGMGGRGAGSLRTEIASYIRSHPNLLIAETPMKDWVRWDSGLTVNTYAGRMKSGGWGGGIEMAACARLKNVNVHVYERTRGGKYKRISCFDAPGGNNKTIHVLYCGGVHYDALVPNGRS